MITVKEIQEVRSILGSNSTDDEIKLVITQTDHLLESWMEAYEKTIYNGKTFDELFSN